MNLNLVCLSHDQLEWKEEIPFSFKGVHLPGSNVLSAVGKFGSVCIQEYHSENFCIRFNVFDLLEKFVIRSFFKKPGLYTRLILKGRIDSEIDNLKWSLYKNQFFVIQSQELVVKETYENKTHLSFDTYFSANLAKELLSIFPSYNSNEQKNRWVDLDTLELVHTILRSKYDKELRRHFFESRSKDLLFKYLLLSEQEVVLEKEATETEMNKIHEAEKIIVADISLHHSIPALSKKVLLNEFRFKLLFKKIFGVGPYEYLVRKRLKKSKELLKSGLSVKEVARLVGYRPSDFTTAFHNQFGFSPSEVPKNS